MTLTLAQQVAREHSVAITATVTLGGETLATLPVNTGVISADRTNKYRRTVSLVVPAIPTLVPSATPVNTDGVNVFGAEVTVSYGVSTQDGTSTATQLGVFRISDIDLVDADDNSVSRHMTIGGYDRSYQVSRALFTDAYTIPVNSNYATAIVAVLKRQAPTFPVVTIVSPTLTPMMAYSVGGDPWAGVTKMAANAGLQIFFDRFGVAQIETLPDWSTAPVAFAYSDGVNATVTEFERKLANGSVPNHIICIGSGAGLRAAVRADAIDSNPTSSTFVGGPYGSVVHTITSSQFATMQQAQAAADQALALHLGSLEQVIVTAVPYPLHDIDDVIQVARSASNLSGYYVVDAYTMPLEPATPMTLTCRRVIGR